MTDDPHLDRRRLLVGGGLAAAFVAIRPWRTFVAIGDVPPIDRLAGLLPADESTRRVGRAYLRAHPDETELAKLVDELTRSLDVRQADLAAHTAAVINGELRSRTIVRIEGWIASPTEARLAALTTLVT